jgi:diaminohydroxyphosphoribosylaminopyrimidine deaminase / 5-amino-6-(5-phosphoribosylamino)uracil reductase
VSVAPAERTAMIRAREAGAMARARELGAGVLGTTSPNPAVGAVVLAADGTPVGEGATAPPGGPHAEVTALAQAGERARGGTVVVTLEPCAHTGRTGPCADALLAAGVARVVVAVPEPTEFAGGGAERLRSAGVDVELGVEQAEAEAGALAGWLTGVRKHRPFVIWKVAATLDGRVAADDGTSRWITGDEARAAVHRLRATCDAVVVGSGTALADDPQLTVRDADGRVAPRQPLRVVVDRRHRLPAAARVLDDAAPTHVSRAGTPGALLTELFDRDVRRVLLEGGPTLAAAFLREGLVDEAVIHLAPKLLGAGPSLVGDLGIPTISGALSLAVTDVTRLGGDVEIRLRPNRHTGGQQFADEGS